ncbi:pyridoxamine 5'-phosphate oxidase family protein [Longitalea luteola]|uniref:pyridoxamine 5'-phosphate oxidase family protein n=1 Tax=Longitalea luteola TaxID=2812563 RepID=UPI001A96DDB9|nr:pyridoxamine 5'-phosphate oxidase family protein [Longitalea luteola]
MYHEGELEAQQRAGERHMAERNGKAMANQIIPGAINFIERQAFFIISTRNNKGELFVSALSGEEGFLKVTSFVTIEINTNLVNSNPADPFWSNIVEQAKTGLLFIEPATRRRFRVNGTIEQENDLLRIVVDQAYPNCPKFIQQRQVLKTGKPGYERPEERGTVLPPDLHEMIRTADTFFVASASNKGDMDASHRGGAPGFVSIQQDGSLLIPDYKGNSLFNTFGNFITNPKAGLLFIDFEKHRTLQLTGSVEILWDHEDAQSISGGTGRYWMFFPAEWILLENLKGFDWNFMEYSPFNP